MTREDRTNRRAARAAALQMLYQVEVGRAGALEAMATYWASRDAEDRIEEPLREFANALVKGTGQDRAEIDGLLARHAQNWRVERMAVIDRIVLRLAVYELLRMPGTPPKVVINEALELARTYSGEEAVPFVNGILDAINRTLHPER